MTYDPQRHHRRSVRLKGYDYSQPGWYFVTICVEDHICILGDVVEGEMHRNAFGDIVQACWNDLPRNHLHVVLDALVVMPNHVHGVIGLMDISDVGADSDSTEPFNRRGLINQTPTTRQLLGNQAENENPDRWILMRNPKPILGKIIRGYKARVTHSIRQAGCCNFTWQRNYYEHIIRNDRELNRIRQYIHENPLRWHYDRLNPANNP